MLTPVGPSHFLPPCIRISAHATQGGSRKRSARKSISARTRGGMYLGTAAGRLARPGPALVSGALTLWLWLAFSARHLAEIPLTETLLSAAAAAAALVAPRLGAGGRMRVAVAVLPPAAPALLAAGLASWRYLAAQSMGY